MLNVKHDAVDSAYQQKLNEQAAITNQKKVELHSPSITPTQRAALYHSGLSDSCCRGVLFLFENQGARTDVISANCAVGNVSDCFIGLKGSNTQKLGNLGLEVKCDKVIAKNRFNRKTHIGTWWLKVVDEHKWCKAQEVAADYLKVSANDDQFHQQRGSHHE